MDSESEPTKLSLSQREDSARFEERPHLYPEVELGCLMPDAALVAAGWVRRHSADPERAQESAELYRSMGFEVRLEHLKPEDFGSHCQQCASVACRSHVIIYTRKLKSETS